MELYVGSAIAFKYYEFSQEYRHTALVVAANNENEAYDKMLYRAYELLPLSSGWVNHQLTYMKVKDSQLHQAGYYKECYR